MYLVVIGMVLSLIAAYSTGLLKKKLKNKTFFLLLVLSFLEKLQPTAI